MEHSFNVGIATKYNVNVAIFLNNLAFWIHKNQANKKHFHDGRYWTYNTQEAFTELFPYWTRQNLRTVIKYCIDNNLIIKGNYNETTYDRTQWYSLTDLGLSLFDCFNNTQKTPNNEPIPIGWNQPMERLEPTNELVRTNQPIPDSKQRKNTDGIDATKPTASLADRQKAFGKSLEPYVSKYGQNMIRAFYEYWTEPNKSQTKFRQELQRTWDTARRLRTWSGRESISQRKSGFPKGAVDGRNLTNMFNDAIASGY